MTLPSYRHELTVANDTISPRGPLDSGTAGDHGAAQLVFRLTDTAAEEYVYRVEAVNGAGGYDITETLTPTDGAITLDVPENWTAAGVATVRLVQLSVADGKETARRYFPPVVLRFAYRDEGNGATTAAPQWQTMLTKTEEGLRKAEDIMQRCLAASDSSAVAAEMASTFAETAASHAWTAEENSNIARSLAEDAEARTAGFEETLNTHELRLNGLDEQAAAAFDYTETVKGIADAAQTNAVNAHNMASEAWSEIGELSKKVENVSGMADNLAGRVDSIEETLREHDVSLCDIGNRVTTLEEQMADIDLALDTIIAIQNELIGGDSE